jgi:hypothetical protein
LPYQLFVDYQRAIALATVTKDVTVTAKTNLDWIQEASDRIMSDPVKLKEFMRKVMGPNQRIIEGQEREHLLTVFRLLEPSEESNNQRSWTTVYEHAGKTYHLTTGDGWDELAEILPDDL